MARYPVPPIDAAERESFPTDYASFSQRVLATSLDCALFVLLLWPCMYIVQNYSQLSDDAQNTKAMLDQLVLSTPAGEPVDYQTARPILLQTLKYQFILLGVQIGLALPLLTLCWKKYDCTPGKWLLKMRIVDISTGDSPTFKQYLIRFIGYVPASLFLGLGLLHVIFSSRRQGWHDIMAGTGVLVIKNKAWIDKSQDEK